jgi:hypothetical protein
MLKDAIVKGFKGGIGSIDPRFLDLDWRREGVAMWSSPVTVEIQQTWLVQTRSSGAGIMETKCHGVHDGKWNSWILEAAVRL